LKGLGEGWGRGLVVVRTAILKMLNETKSALLKMRSSKVLIFQALYMASENKFQDSCSDFIFLRSFIFLFFF
jgi:hypothetical protein